MSLNAFLALLVYALVTSITPGPNNLMLLASGVNFGIARTVPHMLGISMGFLVLLLAVGLGLGAVLTAFPALHTGLKISIAFTIVNLPSVSVWAGFGTALRGFLSDPVRLKWFNIAMGVLLAATLWPMLK